MTTKVCRGGARILAGSGRLPPAARYAMVVLALLLPACGGSAASPKHYVSVRVYQGQAVLVSTSGGQQATVGCGQTGVVAEPADYGQLWTVTITATVGRTLLQQFTLGSGVPASGESGGGAATTAPSGALLVYRYAIDQSPPAQFPVSPNGPSATCT
jgi:hypothetical protein